MYARPVERPGNVPGPVVRLQELLAADEFPEREPAPKLREFAEEIDRGLDELRRVREIRRQCSSVLHSGDAQMGS